MILAWLLLAVQACGPTEAEATRLLAAGNFSAAATGLQSALRVCGEQPHLLEMLARAYLGQQDFAKGLIAASRLVDIQRPPTPGALVLKGNLQYLLAQDEDAERTFQALIAAYPKSEEARYALGRFYYQKQRHELAFEQFQVAVREHPKAYRSWDNLGLCQEALGQEEAAIQSYLKAISLVAVDHPAHDLPYANLANLMINRNEPRKGFDLAVTAAERNPSSARNYYLAAKALTRLEQWDKSERWLRRSVELDASYPEPHYLLGQLLRKLGQTAESDQEFAAFKKLRDAQPASRR